MKRIDNFRNIIDEIEAKARLIKERAEAYAEKETKAAMKRADIEFGAYQQVRIREIFNTAVDSFYQSYSPSYYGRRNSLYDMLQLHTDDSGMVISGLVEATDATDYRGLFDKTMPTDRKGGSLFDIVFVEGWHGGAKSINAAAAATWGAHPSPGVPYYRRGGIVIGKNGKRFYHKYGKWGRQTVRTESPYQKISMDLSSAERGELFEMFISIGDKYNEEAVLKINEKINNLCRTELG